MGSNNFIAFATIPAGAQVGEQPAVDLWSLVPTTGLDPGFNIICVGEFTGTIAIEGSLDGVQFNPLGFFTLGNGQAGSSFELSPIVVDDVVRYIRARVMPGTYIQEAVFLTAGGAQNCDCSGGGGGTVNKIIAGTGIGVSPPAGTGDVTVSNTGVTSLIAGTGIAVDQPTGAVTITLAATLAAIFDYGEAHTPSVDNLMTGPLQRMFFNLGTTPPPFPPNAQPYFPEAGVFIGEFPADSGVGADSKPLMRTQRHFTMFPSLGDQHWIETQYDLFGSGVNSITGGDRTQHVLIDQFDNRLTFLLRSAQLTRPGLFPANISPIYLDNSTVSIYTWAMMDALGFGNTNDWHISSDGNMFRRGLIPNTTGGGGGPPGPWRLNADEISMWSRNGGEPLLGSELFYQVGTIQTFGVDDPLTDQHVVLASSFVVDAKNLGSGQAAGHANWYARSTLNSLIQLVMQAYDTGMVFPRRTNWQPYPTADVSAVDSASTRFNETSERLDLSNNTDPYSRILVQNDISPTPSPLSASPVTDVVSQVQDLTTATLFTVVLNQAGRKFLPIGAYVEFIDVNTLTVGPSIKLGNNGAHDNVAPVLAVPNTVVTADSPPFVMATVPVMVDLNTNAIDCEVTVNATATSCLARIHLIGTYPPEPVLDTPPLANLLQWVKGDAGVTQAGGFVSVWADQSGNGNDLVQATGANQPTYDAGATIQIEGIPAISFDSGNQELTAFGLSIPDVSSVFVVYKRNTTGANGRLVDWNFPTANIRIQSSNPPFFNDAGSGTITGDTIAQPGETVKLLVVRTGTVAELYQMTFDTAVSSEACAAPTSTGIGIGGLVGFNQGADSTIVEWGVYSSALNATERGQLQAYLDLRYPG